MTDLNPTMTLEAIRKAGPCGLDPDQNPPTGFRLLLQSLGMEIGKGKWNPDFVVSLGDIAKSNGAADALWCCRALDWADIAARRAVVGKILLPALRRIKKQPPNAAAWQAELQKWCDGDDSVDLEQLTRNAYAYAYAAAAYAAYANDDDEREHQRADIIAAFPPIALQEFSNDK